MTHARHLRAVPGRIRQWVLPNIRAFVENRQPVIWLLSLVIGLSVAWAAIGFRQLIGLVQLYWLGDTSEQVLTVAGHTPWYMIVAGPAGRRGRRHHRQPFSALAAHGRRGRRDRGKGPDRAAAEPARGFA
jgi:hypothetical protein